MVFLGSLVSEILGDRHLNIVQVVENELKPVTCPPGWLEVGVDLIGVNQTDKMCHRCLDEVRHFCSGANHQPHATKCLFPSVAEVKQQGSRCMTFIPDSFTRTSTGYASSERTTLRDLRDAHATMLRSPLHQNLENGELETA